MKKFLKHLVVSLLLINMGLMVQMTIANADGPDVPTNDYAPIKIIKAIGDQEQTNLGDFATGQHADSPPDYIAKGVGRVSSPILFAIDMFKYFMSGIAFLVVVFQATKLISTANEEEAGKAKSTLLVGILGLVIIQLAGVIVNKIFFGEQGEAFESVTDAQLAAEEGVELLRGILGFVEALIGIITVFIFVTRGFVLLTSAGDEETITTTKKHVMYSVVGLIAVAMSEIVVRGFIFPEAGKSLPDVDTGKFILVEVINFLAAFISVICFVALFYAGYKYVTAAGNEEETETVKKTVFGVVIALVLTLGAFALVNTLIEFQPIDEGYQEGDTVEVAPEEVI
ncbi:hypothetical protein HN709_01215 [Candidatus Peregrinibacteria bacterium]|jgi:hypothetical protein|nr:hypothetical protein [Candidatus Peregrinibacteria bacterium]MBT7736283.1 hypothetical protein [Candidatus Peregrinibacteria bacterium]